LKPGVGYFVKYSDIVDQTIAGSRLTKIDDNIHPTRVYEGWNTIGSLSWPISTENVSLIPFGAGAFPLIIGDIYRYVTDRGYQAVSEIQPGLGYWMKISGQAYLQMIDPDHGKAGVNFSGVRDAMKLSATKLVVASADDKAADLYVSENGAVEAKNIFELPPAPPHELFDVRFTNHSYVEDAASPMIRLQGVTFPVTLTMNGSKSNYTVVNPVTGEVYGSIVAGRSNSIVINDAKAKTLRLLGGDADLAELGVTVTPNPVASVSTVNITVPSNGTVTVELFNVVGERVQVLANGDMTSGAYSFDLNAAGLGAGRYTVKVTNGNNVATSTVTVVR
jgi:hypothetical protein